MEGDVRRKIKSLKKWKVIEGKGKAERSPSLKGDEFRGTEEKGETDY